MDDGTYKSSLALYGIAGIISALAPLPFAFVLGTNPVLSSIWPLVLAAIAAISCVLCGLNLVLNAQIAKTLGAVAAGSFFLAALPQMVNNPVAALIGGITLVAAGFAVVDVSASPPAHFPQYKQLTLLLRRARWALLTTLAVVVSLKVIDNPNQQISSVVIATSLAISQLLCLPWSWRQKNKVYLLFSVIIICLLAYIGWQWQGQNLVSSVLVLSLLTLLVLPHCGHRETDTYHWWDMLFDHPARILFSTFFLLSVFGTLLLELPFAIQTGSIDLVNAAFTAVSAVCVTGLAVLDTGHDFSGGGQLVILLLIQLGGLGIMGITTVALHIMGKRLSLHQERVLNSMTDTDCHDLIGALWLIIKVTVGAEALGALVLSWLFYAGGDSFSQAIWRGLFTAVSAFCNAGFSLQSTSLISYNNQPLILHTVAVLIIIGGLAPATTLIVPRWLRRQPVPVAARLSLSVSAVMLVAGTLALLAFEWNGVLAGLTIGDKIQNAWFQSVTLRTAGFNSVDITSVASPTFLLMLVFMFIGGSPGGTAGGIKTTTVAVLLHTFWANITNHKQVIIYNRRLPAATIYRAITIVGAGVLIWGVIVIMLETTQQVAARDLIYEATSALGTVGLSTGATSQLDSIGKIIIILAMFVGRIGPMSLFMLLSNDHAVPIARCPDAKISLT